MADPAPDSTPASAASAPATSSQSDTAANAAASADLTTTTRTPLHCRWTLWYDNPRFAPAGTLWKDNLKRCGSFDSVEAFWRCFNNMKPPSQLSLNSNYHIFREGILPTWEDPTNIDGGKFVYTMQKKISKTGVCDESWMFTVLAAIGETMDLDGDQVVGAVVSIRKSQDRIALWIKSSDKHICRNIGLRWKKALDIHKVNLKFQVHRDAATTGRSFRNEIQFSV
ncbi:factor isoform 4E-2 [Seminavis robusta]|uniref:Factor isoform 4E-2 n=1 Tax=Seminavis robusta TaxID=568900 RepID=A0A9N8HD02_9STRA|nr:factor isoform 4E-2 [Seminavis robusta]|eukprot:Sro436_g142650.1 factor isoform 4E-2 (225) ;mRNA; r:35820-36570